jgi:hypothetical protein
MSTLLHQRLQRSVRGLMKIRVMAITRMEAKRKGRKINRGHGRKALKFMGLESLWRKHKDNYQNLLDQNTWTQ